ncbi:hypothetical protein C5167_029940 [Papaver somniferum]|nr:hypothetical protein C5167_029940 [Papaver somniferum]
MRLLRFTFLHGSSYGRGRKRSCTRKLSLFVSRVLWRGGHGRSKSLLVKISANIGFLKSMNRYHEGSQSRVTL